MGKATKATIVFLLLLGGVVLYRSLTIARNECEVCITFQGQTVCRTAASGSRQASVESAVTSACGTLASGMTDSIRCQNTTPDSVTCGGR
ncbi:MAG TPA: hypothetical protein VNL37_02490 [Candidatus Polarisedimenticolia bacterium]|nr:hypothetical protein [Candidatus Polarisedimenticolia bacterium]